MLNFEVIKNWKILTFIGEIIANLLSYNTHKLYFVLVVSKYDSLTLLMP